MLGIRSEKTREVGDEKRNPHEATTGRQGARSRLDGLIFSASNAHLAAAKRIDGIGHSNCLVRLSSAKGQELKSDRTSEITEAG